MDKLQRLGTLIYDFEDYKYREYLYVDDLTGSVFRSTEPEESEHFSGVTPSNIVTTKRQYFEETLKPKRYIELPNVQGKKTYQVILYSKELNQPLQCFLTHEEFEGVRSKQVYYFYEISMGVKDINE
ncbi:hypothetical protein ACFDHY_04275 [Staphylococcus hyicus]|uniref:hypothetical protein n=1 Tax=Staphylococcus hyicus TaxID=1284 RepID=UPI0036D39A27